MLLLDYDRLKIWCEANNVHWTGPQFMALHPKVLKFMEQYIHTVNEGLENTEKIKKFVLLYQPWTVESGELTPTLKLKRAEIVKKYHEEIKELYG